MGHKSPGTKGKHEKHEMRRNTTLERPRHISVKPMTTNCSNSGMLQMIILTFHWLLFYENFVHLKN